MLSYILKFVFVVILVPKIASAKEIFSIRLLLKVNKPPHLDSLIPIKVATFPLTLLTILLEIVFVKVFVTAPPVSLNM